jgi:hypothetical protein
MHVIAQLRIALRKAARPGLGQMPVAALAIVGILAPAGLAHPPAPAHSPAPAHPPAPAHRPARGTNPTCQNLPSPDRRELFGTGAQSSLDVWAVGVHWNGSEDRTLAEHWTGTAWRQVASPSPGGRGGSWLNSVAAPSSGSAWAVGSYNHGNVSRNLAEHWNGTAWQAVPIPGRGATMSLNSVAALPSGEAWAVGYHDSGNAPAMVAYHFNGAAWRPAQTQKPAGSAGNALNGVAAVSDGSAWAVGTSYRHGRPARTLIEHWNGTGWTQVPSPSPARGGYNTLASVAVLSATNAWAVGNDSTGVTSSGAKYHPLIEHWNGTAWQVMPGPRLTGADSSPYTGLGSVAATAPMDVWAAGSYCSQAHGLQPLIEHWNGTAWSRVTIPDPASSDATWLTGVTATSATSAWAVGWYNNNLTHYSPLIEHWNGKAWKITRIG